MSFKIFSRDSDGQPDLGTIIFGGTDYICMWYII